MEENKPKEKKKSMKQFIDEVIAKIGEETNIDIMKPVLSRAKARIKKIQAMSQAKITKIPVGNRAMFHTIPPEMFISSLDMSITNGVATITYGVYEMDGKNKKLYEQVADVPQGDNTTKKVVVNAQYRISHLVMETIEFKKTLKTRIIDNDNIGDLNGQ